MTRTLHAPQPFVLYITYHTVSNTVCKWHEVLRRLRSNSRGLYAQIPKAHCCALPDVFRVRRTKISGRHICT